jgi:putative RNA 2'-phosphotransferase
LDDVRLSKRLSFVLRHRPDSIGVALDEAGWVDVAMLLAALAEHGEPVSRERLAAVVASSDKQRFSLDPAKDRIRANQGHSVPVQLGLPATEPPAVLFHGTPERNLPSILVEGLHRSGRHAVHLSGDRVTAERVGGRRGRAVVLEVDAGRMHADGHRFQRSENGVWLTDHVPPAYLRRIGTA